MNPLDLPGPEFLGFYAILTLFGYLVVFGFGLLFEPKEAPPRPLTEAYPIAFLRGGAREALCVVIATLTHRRWLVITGRSISKVEGSPDRSEDPVEQHILDYASESRPIHELLRSDSLSLARDTYEPGLVERNLLPTQSQEAARIGIRAFVAFMLAGLVLLKVLKALERGKTNVLFIIIICVVSIALLFFVRRRRTPAGDVALHDLRTLFSRLRFRSDSKNSHIRNPDFAFLISIFGLGAAGPQYPYVSAIQHSKEPVKASNDSSSSGCSSCSSSSSDSSCGGSCGGGCGGCGG